jgi:hypothetical protein
VDSDQFGRFGSWSPTHSQKTRMDGAQGNRLVNRPPCSDFDSDAVYRDTSTLWGEKIAVAFPLEAERQY